jgi:hypothetical protein
VRRALWAAVLSLGLSTPALAAPAPRLARPDARVTIVAPEVPVGALLSFLASVGGSAVTIGPEVAGVSRAVRIEHARVQDAFDQVVALEGLTVAVIEGRLVVTGRSAASPSPFLPTPMPARPELIIPPQPGR